MQEAALNHVWLSGIGSDGFGTTIQMKLHDLIWVVNRLHVEVDRYPKWYCRSHKLHVSTLITVEE